MAKKKRASKRQSGANKKRAVAEAFAADPDASPTAVTEQLNRDGVDVTVNYVNNIKSQLKKEGTLGQPPAASEEGVNKTQAILEYYLANPDKKPKQASDDLTKKHGVEFKTSTISSTKHQLTKSGKLSGNGRRKGRKGRPGRPTAQAKEQSFSLDELLTAKKMAAQLGGVDKARQVFDALAKLKE